MISDNQFRIFGCWRSSQLINMTHPAEPVPQDMRDHASALFGRFSASRTEAYDGQLVGLRKLNAVGKNLELTGVVVRFSEYLATRSSEHPGWWPRANPIGTTSILATSDGAVLVSVRSVKAEQNPGGLYFVGGFSEFNVHGEFDLFENAGREIEEETGLTISEAVDDITLNGIDYDPMYLHPEAFFLVRLRLSSQELQAHLKYHRHEEAEKFELLTKDKFLAVAASDRALTWSFVIGRQLVEEYL